VPFVELRRVAAERAGAVRGRARGRERRPDARVSLRDELLRRDDGLQVGGDRRLECRRRGQLRDASARRADGFLALRLLARPFCLPAGLRCRLNSLRSAVASDLRQVASGTRGERPLAVLLAGLQGVVAAHGSA
jgi:hypothetical protein